MLRLQRRPDLGKFGHVGARNFNCPETTKPCESKNCTVRSCRIQVEDREHEAARRAYAKHLDEQMIGAFARCVANKILVSWGVQNATPAQVDALVQINPRILGAAQDWLDGRYGRIGKTPPPRSAVAN